MHFSTLVTYLASVLSNHLLKACTALPIKPLISASSFLGFKIRAHSAGVSDNAISAESIMETEMVMANCL